MSRRSSNGSRDKSVRPSSPRRLRRMLDDSDFINYDRIKAPSVPEPESLDDFYSGLREGNKLPFTLNQLGVAVSRASSTDEYDGKRWLKSLEGDYKIAIAKAGPLVVVRACYLDLELERSKRQIDLGAGDGWFSPARAALLGATGQRLEDIKPYQDHVAEIRRRDREHRRAMF
jgi:hypothetical protein